MHVNKINSFSKSFAFILIITIAFWSDALHGKIIPIGSNTDCGNPTVIADPRTHSFRDYNPLYPRIIGGERANPLAWPWQAFVSIQTDQGSFSCGATLLSNKWLLTAAHCVQGSLQRVSVYLGIKDKSEVRQANEQPVDLVVSHGAYDENTIQNDIAMLRLRSPIRFSNKIRPACISDENLPRINQNAIITGWGLTSKRSDGSGSLPNELFQVKVPVVDNSICRFSGTTVQQNQVCVGVIGQSPKGSCNGDSGGPLVMRKDNRFFVVGIVSFGSTLCDFYSVFTRVWSYNSWILAVIQQF